MGGSAEATMDVVGEVLLVIGCGLVLCSSLIWLWSLRPERALWHGTIIHCQSDDDPEVIFWLPICFVAT
jgi:hypothetical protein